MYTCKECGKDFNSVAALGGHSSIHYPGSKDNSYRNGALKWRKQNSKKLKVAYYKNPNRCKECNSIIPYEKKINKFCNSSCSASHTNKHKTYGIRRSKLEIFIENQLKIDFPNLNIMFNEKTVINSELDIYFPDLKIAIEINGIFHYEPIFGEGTFEKIKNNDNQKIINCYENDIELIIINTSKHSNTSKNREQYYNPIKEIIDHNIGRIS